MSIFENGHYRKGHGVIRNMVKFWGGFTRIAPLENMNP